MRVLTSHQGSNFNYILRFSNYIYLFVYSFIVCAYVWVTCHGTYVEVNLLELVLPMQVQGVQLGCQA